MTPRSNRTSTFGQRIRSFSDMIGGARACAAAAEAGRRPSREALRAVGIEPDTYFQIKIG